MPDKIYTKDFQVELDTDKDALASISKNSQFSYMAFILTDDKPNENKQRIPEEEFDNLIESGFYTPLKMAYNEMKDGHEDAFPLGPITHLKKFKNQIKCIATLWARERPEDVEYLKDSFANKLPLNVSWEILYQDSSTNDDGIETLSGTSLRAVTIVGLPAYAGRTPIVAVASKIKEEDTLDELEKTKVELKEIKDELSGIKDELKSRSEEVDTKETELTELRDFNTNKELLLGLSSEALEFMIQELVAFSTTKDKNSSSSLTIPNLNSSPDNTLNITELAQVLRKRLEKRE